MRSGEKPTCAGPLPVRKSLPALRLATGRRGRTRAGPRGAVSEWSGRTSLLGSGWWRSVRRTHPWYVGSVGSPSGGLVVGMYADRSGGPRRDYRSRQARWQSTVTTGILTSWSPSRVKTRLYKLCEISPRRRLRDGFVRVFGGISSSCRSPGPWPAGVGTSGGSQADGEGRNRSGRRSRAPRCHAYNALTRNPLTSMCASACAKERCRSGLRARDTAYSRSLRALEGNPGSWLGNGPKRCGTHVLLATYGR